MTVKEAKQLEILKARRQEWLSQHESSTKQFVCPEGPDPEKLLAVTAWLDDLAGGPIKEEGKK